MLITAQWADSLILPPSIPPHSHILVKQFDGYMLLCPERDQLFSVCSRVIDNQGERGVDNMDLFLNFRIPTRDS